MAFFCSSVIKYFVKDGEILILNMIYPLYFPYSTPFLKYLPNWLKWLEITYDLEDVGEQYPKVKIKAEQLNICEE